MKVAVDELHKKFVASYETRKVIIIFIRARPTFSQVGLIQNVAAYTDIYASVSEMSTP